MRVFSYMNNILVLEERKFYDSRFFYWPQMLCMHWGQDWVCNLYLNQGLVYTWEACRMSDFGGLIKCVVV